MKARPDDLEQTAYWIWGLAALAFVSLFLLGSLLGQKNGVQRVIDGLLLAIFLIVAQTPLYPAYISVVSSVSGLTPIADQRLAAGLMWAAGMVPFNLGIALAVLRLLNGEEQAELAQAVQREEVG